MSCSARLPVYVVFSLALFAQRANQVIWALYALGISVAAVVGLIFSRTLFKAREQSVFFIELPPYNVPTLKNLWFHVSQRTGRFIRNAGTVILAASVVIWVLLNLPFGVPSLDDSWFGKVSNLIAPVFQPAGFGNWQTSGSLVTGLIAKEVVVSTMSEIYLGEAKADEDVAPTSFLEDLVSIGDEFMVATVDAGKKMIEVLTPGIRVFKAEPVVEDTALSGVLREQFTPLSALAFLTFVLLYVPCVATLGTIRAEFGWKWAAFSAVYQTGIAWSLSVLVFQGGRLLGYA